MTKSRRKSQTPNLRPGGHPIIFKPWFKKEDRQILKVSLNILKDFPRLKRGVAAIQGDGATEV